jgi:hypothetical protein
MNLLKKLFNPNTGYFVEKRVAKTSVGNPFYGYILSHGYTCFGIPRIERVAICSSKEQLIKWINFLEIKNIEIP